MLSLISAVYLFDRCGTERVTCKMLYTFGITILLYITVDYTIDHVIIDRCLEVAPSRRQQVRKYIIHVMLIIICLSLYTTDGVFSIT